MVITSNIPRERKNYIGSIEKVYLFPFTEYIFSEITLSGQQLRTFPSTTIYRYHSTVSSYQEVTSMQGGAVAWDQSLSLQFPKTNETKEIYKLMYQDYRAIIVDYLGNIRILGLWNGLETSVTNETGSGKSEMNGYRVTLSGREDNQAYFIDTLTGAGFTENTVNNIVYVDGCNMVFVNGDNLISV